MDISVDDLSTGRDFRGGRHSDCFRCGSPSCRARLSRQHIANSADSWGDERFQGGACTESFVILSVRVVGFTIRR